MNDSTIRVVEPIGYVVGATLAGVGPAIGAAVAKQRPAVGAIVGSALANTTVIGIAAGMNPIGSRKSMWLWPSIFTATAITGTGGALGAAVSDRNPAFGAFVGAAMFAAAGYAIHRLRAPQPAGQISGVPCDALARVSAGAFP